MNYRQTLIFQDLVTTFYQHGISLPPDQVRAMAERFCRQCEEVDREGPAERSPAPLLVKAREAAKMLRCSMATLDRFRREEGLPAIAMNPGAEKVRFLYRPDDIVAFLDQMAERGQA